jgi:hypothetical protein
MRQHASFARFARRVALIGSVLAPSVVLAQAARGTASISMHGTTMEVEYGRPALEGRDMLAKAKRGFVWRLGADQATSLKVTGPVVFGNMVIPKGEYSLFMQRVNEREWSLVVNRQTGQWGTEHNPRDDLFGIPLKWEKLEESVEILTIEMAPEADSEDTGILSIRWGQDLLRQRFRVPDVSS